MEKLSCDCHQRIGTAINSQASFEKLRTFFEKRVSTGIFEEVRVKKPYHSSGNRALYAGHWYRCQICGCLWEFIEPDFPAKGRVRKFPDGRYFDEEEELTRELAKKGKLARDKRQGLKKVEVILLLICLCAAAWTLFLHWRIMELESELQSLSVQVLEEPGVSSRMAEIQRTLYGRGLYSCRTSAASWAGISGFASACVFLEVLRKSLHGK